MKIQQEVRLKYRAPGHQQPVQCFSGDWLHSIQKQ